MSKYILVKNNKVDNVIVGDKEFVEFIKNDYDLILDFEEVNQSVSIGYDVIVNADGSVSFCPPYAEPDYIDAEIIQGELE